MNMIKILFVFHLFSSQGCTVQFRVQYTEIPWHNGQLSVTLCEILEIMVVVFHAERIAMLNAKQMITELCASAYYSKLGVQYYNDTTWACFRNGIEPRVGLANSLWASYQIRKFPGCAYTGNATNVFPATYFNGNRKLAI